MEFEYEPAWVASKEARPLSLSLPLSLDRLPIKGEKVEFFFDNLLPDSTVIRRRIRDRFQTKRAGTFDLLEAVGRDCVGAVQLLPEGTTPEGVFEIRVTQLDEAEVERTLLRAVSEPDRYSGDDEEFRFSLAGAQEKTALTWHQGHWCKPLGATPTTHIFKLPLGLVGGSQLDMRTSLENEWLCAQILEQYGVPVAQCSLMRFGATQTLVVTRFDRQLHSSQRYWLRLPQEDFCQATGRPSSRKYEADGGPSLIEIARVLQGSESPTDDLSTLLRAQLLFWMLAATDGHAKNFSIRLLAQGRYRLTPVYDVLSAWPITGSGGAQRHPKKLKLAMALHGKNKHYRVEEIARRHFRATAKLCGVASSMDPIISDVLTRTSSVINDVSRRLPEGFPVSVFESVTSGLQRAAARLEADAS
jgi:serine/threonine-protein kinase HipA